MSTCRICHKWNEPLFKYSVRHYAHADCAFDKFGAAFLDMIPAHQVGNLPWRAVSKAGLLDDATTRIKAYKQAQS